MCDDDESRRAAAYAMATPIVRATAPIDSTTTGMGSVLGMSNTQAFGTPTRGCYYAPPPPPPAPASAPPPATPSSEWCRDCGTQTRIVSACAVSVPSTRALMTPLLRNPQEAAIIAANKGYLFNIGIDTVLVSQERGC